MILPLIRLMRLYYVVPMTGGFFVIVLYRTAGSLHDNTSKLIFAACALIAIIAAGYVLNDVCDLTADRINSPRRPLPKNQISRKTTTVFAVVLFAIGLSFAAICGIGFFAMLSVVAAGLFLYDLFSKKIGFFKDLWVAALMTCLYPLAFTLVEPICGPRMNSLCISPFWLFLSTLGYEMLKDVRDHHGDRIVDKRSIAAFSEKRWFLILAKCFALLGTSISLIPYALSQCREIYFVACIVAVLLTLLCLRLKSFKGLPLLYASIALVTLGAFFDLMVYGSLK